MSDQPFRFLDLPLELRRKVYRYVIGDRTIHFSRSFLGAMNSAPIRAHTHPGGGFEPEPGLECVSLSQVHDPESGELILSTQTLEELTSSI